MKRFVLFIVFICCIQSLFSQEFDTINQKDELGRKQGYWIYYGKDRPESGYPIEGIVEKGFYTNDRKDSIWIKYYNDGMHVKLIGTFRNNRPSGPYEKYYQSGQIMEKGFFSYGKYEGSLYRWWENGNLKYLETTDSVAYYHPSGCPDIIYVVDSITKMATRFDFYRDSCGQVKTKSKVPMYVPEHSTRAGELVPKPSGCSFGSSNRNTYRTEAFISEHPEYSDSSICSCQTYENERIKCYNSPNKDILFMGTCKDSKIDGGRIYFYDEDAILLRIEIWKEGEFYAPGKL